MTSLRKRIIAASIVFVMILSAAPAPAQAATAEELQAQITALQAQLNALLAQLGDLGGETSTPTGNVPAACSGITFNTNLMLGSTGNDVKCLQALLNTDSSTKLADSGAGSPGNETTYFGNITRAAVVKFQEKYAADVLAVYGLTAGTGFFGTTSRAKANAILAAGTEEPEPVGQASDYDNQTDCEAANYYWYNSVCNAAAEVTEPTTAGGLSVALASDTPAAATFADGTAFNNTLKLKLTASSSGAVNVTGLKLTKGGISANTYVEGISVIDGSGVRHGAILTSLAADSTAPLTFSSDPIVVPAGQSVYATVQLNIGSSFGAGTINMSLASASDVTSNASSVSGAFPIQSNTMSVVDGAATVGGLYVDAVQFHSNGTDDATVVYVNLGTTDQIIGKLEFTESAASASEDVQIKKVTIYNNGNTTDADIANIDLVAPDGTVVATVASTTGKYATFDLSASPYTVPDGTAKIFTLRCDIVSGSTRTVRFLVENDYDVVVTGASSGAGILPTADSGGSDTAYPVGDLNGTNYINKVTIASGSLSVSKDTSSPSGNLSVGATNQTLAKFKLTASGEDMRVDRIRLGITIPAAAYELAGNTKIVGPDGETLYSLVSSTDNLYSTGTTAQYSLTTRLTVPAGTSKLISVVSDVKTTATSAYTYNAGVEDFYVRRMSSGDYVTYAASTVSGNTLTVSTSALSLAKNEAYGNRYEVAGGSKVKIASFVLEAGSAEAINISSMNVVIAPDGGVGTGVIGDYTNMIIEKGDGTQLGSTVVSPTATSGDTVSISGFQVLASGSEIINIYVDITSAALTGETGIVTLGTIGATGASSATSITTPSDTAGQTITWAASGALTVSTDSSTPAVAVLHASESDVVVLKFVLGSLYENINVTKIIIESANGAANAQNVKLFNGLTQVGSTVSLTGGKATFTGLSLAVPKDSALYMTVKAGTTASGTMISAKDMQFMVGTVESTGGNSGVTIYPAAVQTTLTAAGNQTITANTADQALDVASTDGFAVGDVVHVTMQAGTTDGTGFYVVDAITDADTLAIRGDVLGGSTANLDSDGNVTGTVTKLPTLTTTTIAVGSSQTVTADTASQALDVASTAGFAVGDVLFVSMSAGTVSGSGFYVVDSVTDADTLAISGRTLNAAGNLQGDGAVTGKVTKLITGATTTVSTSANQTITANTASALDVASTTGFAVGDVIFVEILSGTTNGSGFYLVDAVTDSDTLSIRGDALGGTGNLVADGSVTGKVTKIGTARTTTYTAGVATITANTASQTCNVASTTGFTAGDLVFVTTTTGTAGSGFYAVNSVTDADTLAIVGQTAAGGNIVTTADSTGKVSALWSLGAAGNPNVLHDVEPLVALNASSPSGTGAASTLETIMKLDVTAYGPRDLMIESMTFYRGGNTTGVETGDTPQVYVGTALQGSGVAWGGETAGLSSLVDFTTPYTIGAGQTVTFDIKVNTSDISTVNETFQLYLGNTAGVKTAADLGVDWYYTATSPSPGTEPTAASPASYCDNYPVYGNTLRY